MLMSVLGGMVEVGSFWVCMLSRLAFIWTWGSTFSSDLVRLNRTESCLHVYLPCSRASGHADKMCLEERKDYWPDGKPSVILLQKYISVSSSVRNLYIVL